MSVHLAIPQPLEPTPSSATAAFCALESLENILLTFLPVSQECQSSESLSQFSKRLWGRGVGGGGGKVVGAGFFSSLKSCLRFPWIKIN